MFSAYKSHVTVSILFLLVLLDHEADGFGPKKLYTLELDANLVSVNVINKRLVLVGSYYIGEIENIQWNYAQIGRMKTELNVLNTEIPDARFVDKLPYGTLSGKELFYYISSWTTNSTDGHIAIMRKANGYGEFRNIDVGSGWSYDRAIWVDMNRDRRKDCLTARYRDGVGQLLFFSQPSDQGVWQQHIINEGAADGNFKTIQHYKRNYIVVAANQFSSLSVFWTTHPRGKWDDSKKLRKTVVDNYGKYYDVQHVDLNNDGRKDILTTTLKVADSRGQVLGYDLPNDLRYGKWKRHVLAAGFTSEFSPGKAIAYFPNKFKAKSERPSIFLTGGSSGKLFLLSPRPKTKGWSYVKTSMAVSSVGAVGIPWIGDLNEDSYPEVFVPQGNKLHVFAYDYATSAAEPPASSVKEAQGKMKVSRAPVKNRSPYFRPGSGSSSLPEGGGGSDVTSGGGSVKPVYENEKPAPPATNANRPQQPSASGARPVASSNNQPKLPSPGIIQPLQPINSNQQVPFNPKPVYQNGQQPSVASGNLPGRPVQPTVVWRPVLLPGQSVNQQGQVLDQQGRLVPNPPGQYVSVQGQTINSQGQAISPQGQVINPQGQYVNQQGQYVNLQGQYVNSQGQIINTQGQFVANQQQVPSPQGQIPQGQAPQGTSNGGRIPPLLLARPVDQTYRSTPFNMPTPPPIVISPITNTTTQSTTTPKPFKVRYLELTMERYMEHGSASRACKNIKRELCSIKQLQEAVKRLDAIPDLTWAWFNQSDRAAKLESCVPGEVKFEGYECYNGDLIHAPVINRANLQAFCCATVNGANFTRDKFRSHEEAKQGCKKMNRHLCSYDEMIQTHIMSTYKDLDWGWFGERDVMIRMASFCNVESRPWPGYRCNEGLMETSSINSEVVEERAYCCSSRSSNLHHRNFTLILFSLLLAFLS